MYKNAERKKQHVPSKDTAGSNVPYLSKLTNVPNLTLMSLYGDKEQESSGGLSAEALKDQILSRQPGAQIHRQAQIPQAEQEADRLSASVTATSPEAVKADLGRRMGADFSGVRFHTGADAQSKAAAMDARAFTSGSDIYFGPGGFDPTIAAHELVHTVQQGAVDSGTATLSTPAGGVQMWPWSKKKGTEGATDNRGFFGKLFDKIKRPTKSIVDWAERRTGHQVDPAENQEMPLGLDEFFQEDLTAPTAQPQQPKNWRQRAGGWLKKKASSALEWGKDKVAGFITSAKRKNDEAVDQFNTFEADYRSKPLHERILWSLKNPLARLTASRRKKGTAKRAAHRAAIEEQAAAYTASLKGRDLLEARARRGELPEEEDSQEETEAAPAEAVKERAAEVEAAQPAAPQATAAQPEAAEEEDEEDTSLADLFMEHGETVAGQFSGDLDAHNEFLESGGTRGEKMSTFGQYAGMLESGLSTINAFKETDEYLSNARERAAMGDRTGALSSRFRALGSGLNGVSSGATFGQYAALGNAQGLDPISSVAGATSNFANGTADTIDAIDSGKRMGRMKRAQAALEAKLANDGKLGVDDALMLSMARQGGGVAKSDTIQYGTAAAGNFIQGLGGIATATGAGAPVGKVLNTLGSATTKIGASVADSKRKQVRTQVANEEFSIDKRIERYLKEHPGVSHHDAKLIVLKGLGFHSGKRSEAFAAGTIRRIDKGFAAEQAGNTQMGAFFDALSVPQVNGVRSRNLAGDRLGLRGEGDLEERKEAISRSRDLINPFRKKRQNGAS